ncbi:MAG: hypothetical protein WCB59_15165, partial [Candidatus Sulfotelmatobacter sp.]
RLMLSIWSLMHGTAMLAIRGGAVGPLRTQMFHACLDAVEAVVAECARSKGRTCSGPKWPANLILGEEAKSKAVPSEDDGKTKSQRGQKKIRKTPTVRAQRIRMLS